MCIAESGSEKKFKIGEYLKKLQARAWLSHALFARLANTLLKDTESARDNHILHRRISLWCYQRTRRRSACGLHGPYM